MIKNLQKESKLILISLCMKFLPPLFVSLHKKKNNLNNVKRRQELSRVKTILL